MSKELRQKAKTKFPTFDWKLVRKLCWDCKRAIVSESEKRIKKRGPKPCKRRENGTLPSIAPSPEENMDNNQPSTSAGLRMLLPLPVENNINIPDPNDGIEYDLASQDYTMSSATSQCTVNDSQPASQVTDFLLEDINGLLQKMHVSPLKKTTIHRPAQLRDTFKKAVNRLTTDFSTLTGEKYDLEKEKDKQCEFCDTLFISMCERYRSAKTKEEKFKILTSLPGRFNATDIQCESGCTYYTALLAITLKSEKGVFSAPSPRVGRTIPQDVVDKVIAWYHDNDNSRPSPNMNIAIGPMNAKRARRFMFMNQIDAYALFKIQHPECQIKKTKFISLCPKECVWPKHKPYHNFCVCIICSNFEYLYEATGSTAPLKDFLESITCQPITQECAYGLCDNCPRMEEIYELLDTIDTEEITYKQWKRTDGTELQDVTVRVADFNNLFQMSLVAYIEHIYIKEKQKMYIKYIKTDVLPNRRALLIVVDFAQNYSITVQNAVQSYHWSAKQVTVHPFCVMWFDPNTQKLVEKAYVVLSDELSHDADTFNTFKRKVLSHIKVDLRDFDPEHVYYVSDNCGGQYKNFKNYAHLMDHENTFGLTAEWIFTAPGHGKSSADRVTAVVKSTTRIHSLKANNYILTAQSMYDFCVVKLGCETMKFLFISKEETAAERDTFLDLYNVTRKIRGTRTYHHIVPLGNGRVTLYKVAGSLNSEIFSITRDYTLLYNPRDVNPGDFLCFVEANMIQVGMFIEQDNDYAELQCMNVTRRGFKLRWPAIQIFNRVALIDILMKLDDPILGEGGRYFMYSDEQIGAMHTRYDQWHKMRH